MKIHEESWLCITPIRCYVPGVKTEDERIGERIKELRLEEGLSQAELAERMSALGVSMQQQTILKIEKGTRSLKLAEAAALASCLRTFVSQLVPLENEAQRVHQLVTMATESRKRGYQAAELLYEAEEISMALQGELEDAPDTVIQLLPDIVTASAGCSIDVILKRHLSVVRKLVEDPDFEFGDDWAPKYEARQREKRRALMSDG